MDIDLVGKGIHFYLNAHVFNVELLNLKAIIYFYQPINLDQHLCISTFKK